MQISRSFTKVYTKQRKPLAWKPFLQTLDDIVLEDAEAVIRFALAKETRTIDRPRSHNKQKAKTQ
jgi:hypothetical protein